MNKNIHQLPEGAEAGAEDVSTDVLSADKKGSRIIMAATRRKQIEHNLQQFLHGW
jgi:hypothetical protein